MFAYLYSIIFGTKQDTASQHEVEKGISMTKPKKCILLGLKKSVVDDAIAQLPDPAFELIGCLSIQEMRAVLQQTNIDHVFIGAGLDIDIRINAARTVLETSQVTQVHLKNFSAGPQGYVPFIRTILAGVKSQAGR